VKLRSFLTLLSISVVIILLAVVWFFPSNDDFRVENPFWNGTKNTESMVPASPLVNLSDLPSSPGGSTLILIPYADFTQAELEELQTFVAQGGTLVLADDYGFGNRILEYLGLKARFAGQALLDPLFNYKNEWFPKISHLTPSPITSNIESLIFNHATCLTDVESDSVLAFSSSFSFLDLNTNQTHDENEPTGPLPVISSHSLGSGQLILVSDPSIFINSMSTMESNYEFAQNITAITTSRLLIDQSHLPPSNLSQTKNLLAYIRGFFSVPVGAIGLVVAALTITLIPIFRKKEGNNEKGESKETALA